MVVVGVEKVLGNEEGEALVDRRFVCPFASGEASGAFFFLSSFIYSLYF